MVEETTSPAMWLDLLPKRSCENIAAHVTYGNFHCWGTNLARASKKQYRAVSSTLPTPADVLFKISELHRGYDIDDNDDEKFAEEWALEFPQYEVHLILVGGELTPHIADFLRSSNVTRCTLRGRKLAIFDIPPLKITKIYDEVLVKESIRYFSIDLTWNNANVKELFRQMSAMSLEELHLNGIITSGDWLLELASACLEIATRCPSLSVIGMSDLSITEYDDRLGIKQYQNETYWRAVERLPACCEIAVHSTPPDRLVGKLRTLRGLEVLDLPLRKTAALGPSVTSYQRSWGYITAEELDPLKNCRNIRDLELRLTSEAISHLPEILRHCTSVYSLSISYKFKFPNGALLKVVEKAPQLADLKVNGAQCSPTEWKAALEVMGGQLRELFVIDNCSIQYDSFDEQVDRLEVMLRSVVMYNRGLTVFSHGKIYCPFELRRHGQERKDSTVALASRVQAAMPCMNSGELEGDCESFFSIPVPNTR